MDVAVRTEAVLLQQGPISSLALSLQEHPPRVRMGLAFFAPSRCSYSRSRSPRWLCPCRGARPGCEWGWRFSHRGGAPTADPDLLVSSVLAGAFAPGANGCGGSHRGGAPTAGPDLLVSSVLVGGTRPGCEWGWRFLHRGGAPTADPDLLVSSVLVGAHAPGANGAGGFRTEAVLLQQIPISSLALSL